MTIGAEALDMGVCDRVWRCRKPVLCRIAPFRPPLSGKCAEQHLIWIRLGGGRDGLSSSCLFRVS